MIFPGIMGAEKPRAVLERLLASGRIPHAILFHGPEGVGKGTLARLFAQSLLCESASGGAACGACGPCLKVAHGNHPDLFVVTRLPKPGKGGSDESDIDADEGDAPPAGAPGRKDGLRSFLLVSQVRSVIEHVSYAPREGRRRVFIVDPADRLLPEAQNALLKTLEEPPGQAVILLVASRPHVLLPTVRSRCFQLGFGAMPPEALAEALEARGLAPAEAQARAGLSEGRPGVALGLDLPGKTRRRDALLTAVTALATSSGAVADLPAMAAELVGDDEDSFLEGLELVGAVLRDACRAATGAPAVFHPDTRPRVDALGKALGAERAAELLALADRLRRDLRLNLNRALAAESLLAAVAGAPVPGTA